MEKEFFKKYDEKYGFEAVCVPEFLNSKETAELAKGFEAVLLRGNCFANKENLDMYKEFGVKYLLTRSVGTDHIDTPYAKELGFKLARVPFYSPNAIGELAVTHAMMLLRHMAYTTDRARKKNFIVDNFMFSKEIRNCTVGIIGLGKIGRTTAKIFSGMGATVIGQDVFKIDGLDGIATQVEMDEILEKSDIISLHCPYIKENGKIVTREFLSKMKKGAILVNTARGELQDIDAIIEFVENGHLGGVGLDVLEGEAKIFFKDFEEASLPDETMEKLISLYPKILISPHIGSYTDEAVANMVETSFLNLRNYLETGDCENKF